MTPATSHSKSHMGIASDISERVEETLGADYDVTEARTVPSRSSLTFGATAKKLWARAVYIDMRGSKDLVSASGPLTALKAHKAFLYAVTKCFRAEGGEPRSFNGDSVLAFFAGKGSDSAVRAVRAAMKARYAIDEIVNPELEERYEHSLNYGIGIGQGEIHVGKSGVAGDENFQDLVWIGWPVYHAVVYGDKASKPKALWISKNIWNAIKDNENMVYSNGKTMWSYADESFSIGTFRVYKTNYRWIIK